MKRYVLICRSDKSNHWASTPMEDKNSLLEFWRSMILEHPDDRFYIAEEICNVHINIDTEDF